MFSARDAAAFTQFDDIAGSYLRGEATLADLVFEVQSIVESVSVRTSQERDILRELWGAIDEIYAVLLDEKRDVTPEEKQIIRRNLERLQSILRGLRQRSDSEKNK